jgi:malonyl-CoA O-methyltransferase
VHTVTTKEQPVPSLDPVASQRWWQRDRQHSPWLHDTIAQRMVERIDCFRTSPASWLHVEPMLGGLAGHRLLRQRLPQARVVVYSHNMAAALRATQESLTRWYLPWTWGRSFRPARADAQQPVALVWANMLLHLTPEPQALMRLWLQHLQPEGFVLFSCLGPDSLRELRQVHAQMGWPPPHHDFTDMHDWGDMLVQVGFAEPVMDMERITLTYSHATALLDDLRSMGRNLSTQRTAHLQGRAGRERWLAAVEAHLPRDDQGRLTLTLEIIHGHAAKAPPRVPLSATATVSVEDMRAMLRPKSLKEH